MTEKVIFSNEICVALNNLLRQGFDNTRIFNGSYLNKWSGEYEILNKIDSNLLMKALIIGYLPECGAEEQIKIYFDIPRVNPMMSKEKAYQHGLMDALDALEIKYDWMYEGR